MIASSAPWLYLQLIQLNTVTSLTSLLSHENTDIAIAVIELLVELTDEDVVGIESEAAQEGIVAFSRSLV